MPNHIKARRKQLKLTQQSIADQAGTTKATVMKLEKGHMQLTENWMKRLAPALQCRPEDLIASQWPEDVLLVGKVLGKSEVIFYTEVPIAGIAEPKPDWGKGLESVPRPPEGEYRDVMALKVTDDALEPLLPAGSLLYCAETITENFIHYFDQLVVCEVVSGDVHVARLQRGYEFGTYNLLKPNGVPMNDVTLIWCAKVIFLKPA